MAISYIDTAWNTSGTIVSGDTVYKDIVISGCQVGDLLVVFGATEGAGSPTSNSNVATQSGSTGAWTVVRPAVVNGGDVGFVAGYALVATAGSVTVRVTIQTFSFSNRFGVGAYLIPVADKGATYGFVGTGFVGDVDGLVSTTLSGSSTVIYMAGDWSALNLGTTTSPAGGTVNRSYFDTSWYAAWTAHWLGQASGTRNYGPSGLSSHDISGALFRMDTPAGGSSVTVTATGGVTLSGTSPQVVQLARTAAGGVALGGSSPQVTQLSRTATGSITLSGSAPQVTQVARTAAGGPALGGSAPQSSLEVRTATGGLTLSGSSPQVTQLFRTALDGITLGGSASQVTQVTRSAAGSVTLGGIGALAGGSPTVTASGGVILGGAATQVTSLTRTAAGGVTLSDTALAIVRHVATASGGITLGGAAEADTSSGNPVRTASGGITLGGTASTVVAVTRTAVGGIALSGLASLAGGSVTRTAVGGITLGGSATAQVAVVRTATAALALGGIAAMVGGSLTRTAAGGVALSGSATLSGGTITRTAVGTLTLGGSALITPSEGFPVIPKSRSVRAITTGGISVITPSRATSAPPARYIQQITRR